MSRGWPLALLAFVFIWLIANVSSVVLWGIAIFFIVATISLMIILYFQGKFIGPQTLVDDVRLVGRRIIRDEGGEAELAEERKRRYADENNDFYDNEIETDEVIINTSSPSNKE